jgi:hypothetical protein
MVKLRDARATREFEKLASAKRDETDKKKIAGWEEQLTKQAAR